MILPDVNLLIYAYNADAVQHPASRRWLEGVLSSTDRPVGLSWVVILGFLRIVTHPRLLPHPVAIDRATAAVRSWLALPHVQIVVPGEEHASRLFALLDSMGTAANLTTDAHLAALALEYRAEVATCDADFVRFRGVHHFNPLLP